MFSFFEVLTSNFNILDTKKSRTLSKKSAKSGIVLGFSNCGFAEFIKFDESQIELVPSEDSSPSNSIEWNFTHAHRYRSHKVHDFWYCDCWIFGTILNFDYYPRFSLLLLVKRPIRKVYSNKGLFKKTFEINNLVTFRWFS